MIEKLLTSIRIIISMATANRLRIEIWQQDLRDTPTLLEDASIQITKISELSVTDKGFSSIRSVSCVQLFATPWTAEQEASLFITNSWSSLKLTSIELVVSPSHLILCRPLLLLPLIFLSIRVFSSESVLCIRWPKYWSFIRIIKSIETFLFFSVSEAQHS